MRDADVSRILGISTSAVPAKRLTSDADETLLTT